MGSAETSSHNHNISQNFLQNSLGDELEISEYSVVSGTKPGDNFMSLIYSAEVGGTDKNGDKMSKNLLLKCYPLHPTRQELNNKLNIFFKELEIYRVWMPELRRFQTDVIGLEKPLQLPYPPFVNGKCIDFGSIKDGETVDSSNPLENHIILEDLRPRGFRMTNRREPMDIDHIRLVVLELAKIHALSWAYKSHVERDVKAKFPCLVGGFSIDDMEMFSDFAKVNVDQAVKILDESLGAGNDLGKALAGFKDKLITVFEINLGVKEESELDTLLRVKNNNRFGKDAENPVPWRVVSHGDCWSNNMLFRYDETTKKPLEVVLVDLQMATETCIIPDLVYAIYASTDAVLRKNHLEELMKLYVDAFNGFCKTLKTETLPGFNLESFKYRFHRQKLFGLQLALQLLPIMLKEDEDTQDLEKMNKDADMMEMFGDVLKVSGNNSNFTNRLIGLVQELFDDGVI